MEPSADNSGPHATTSGTERSQHSSLESTSLPPPNSKRRRTVPSSTDGCRTCRLRKVKCTGNPGNGPCTNCARLELACPFDDPDSSSEATGKVSRTTPSRSHTEAGTLRKRAQRACNQCHSQKTKCSGDLPRCRRCEASNLACEYSASKRKFTNLQLTSSPSTSQAIETPSSTRKSSPAKSIAASVVSCTEEWGNHILTIDTSILTAEELLSRKNTITRHMDVYFEYIYYMPCMGFFRRNKVYQDVQDGNFPPATAAAMCAITSLFVNPCEAGRVFAMKCSNDVDLYIFRGISRFDERMMILYALNCYHNFLHGHLAKVWQGFGIAARLMVGLQVNWDVRSRDRPFAEQEMMRRVVWQLFYLDRLLAGGYDEYIVCREDIMKIRLPCREEDFKEDRPVVVERLNEKPGKDAIGNMGIHGYQLRLIALRHRILVSARKMSDGHGGNSANKSRIEPSRVMSSINAFQNELSYINASLPECLRLNHRNIDHAMSSEYSTGYVFIHTCLASIHMDLYSFCLPGLREQVSPELLRKLPREFIAKSQKQAVAHALTLARLCDTLQRRIDSGAAGSMKLVGCSSMVKFTTQCLRFLLTAMQHGLYQDLADHTTAPLWRNEPADEVHIRELIGSLLKISKQWCQIIPRNQQTYDRNKAAVEQFYKTRQYADQKPTALRPHANPADQIQLPGPQDILETAFVSPVIERQRSIQTSPSLDAAVWFGTAQPAVTPPPMTEHEQEVGFDAEFGPPGLPMFLAEAQGVQPTPTDDVDTFDATDDLLLISNKIKQMPDFGGELLPPSDHTLGLGVSGAFVTDSFHRGRTEPMGIFQPPAYYSPPRGDRSANASPEA
ncbi:hypothetical protein BGZ63DRAFT_107242 [Mariannaea sp. PMI_226]|nr:hypothetical protein BGZ63DRAFT_107242 [Mariannaea sp. PMI_226]